jgi:hypothetical protein
METEVQPVSAGETHVSLSGPAVFCNRFFISVGPVVRIAFAEQEAGESKESIFRTAVALSHADAISLAHILAKLLKPIEDQLDAAVAAQSVAKPAAQSHGE